MVATVALPLLTPAVQAQAPPRGPLKVYVDAAPGPARDRSEIASRRKAADVLASFSSAISFAPPSPTRTPPLRT